MNSARLSALGENEIMETYSFKSVGICALLVEYLDASGEFTKTEHIDFASMVEQRIRKSVPSWAVQKVNTGGKLGAPIAQPKAAQKVSATGTITLTTGIRRIIPSNGLGMLVRLDAALADLESCSIVGSFLPKADSYLNDQLEQFAKEFALSRGVEQAPGTKPETKA